MMLNNPFVAILAGTLITALIQSSAASLGILQSLALTGSISFHHGAADHHGPEYRHLRHGAALLDRHSKTRSA